MINYVNEIPHPLALYDLLDYAIDIFYEAAKRTPFNCFLKPDTRLPMMYLPDCIRATMEFLEAPVDKLTLRTYNITAVSFTPAELVEEVRKHYPTLQVNYNPDHRQGIGEFQYVCTLMDFIFILSSISYGHHW